MEPPVIWAETVGEDRMLVQCRGGAVTVVNANASMEVIQTMQTFSIGFCKAATRGDLMAMPAEEDGCVRLWDLRTGQPSATLSLGEGEAKTGMCLAIHLQAQRALAFFENGWAYCWDLEGRKVLAQAKLQSEPIICVAASLDGAAGITGSSGNSLVRFDLLASEIKRGAAVALPQAGVNDVRVRGDEKIYATAGWDHRVRVFSWKKNTPLAVLKFHTAPVNCVAFQPQSNLLAAASADGRLAVWSIY